MKTYGQFCSIARALDLLGERWTLLVVRELLAGSARFGDIARGIPRLSRTMLSARLRDLVDAGVIERHDDGGRPTYALTQAGEELAAVVREVGAWGQRWLPRELRPEQLDLDLLAWDVRRRIDVDALPARPLLVRFEATGRGGGVRHLLMRRNEISLCSTNPGFPVAIVVRAPLAVLVAWWRGDVSYADACAGGMRVAGSKAHVRMFPRLFLRYALADVARAG